MGLKESELDILQIVAMISSGLSVIGCSLVLYKLSSSLTVWSITNKQLLILCIIDLITAIFWGIGQYWIKYHALCQFQGFMIQFGGMCNILWNSTIAYLLFHWIVQKQSSEKLDKKFKWTLIGCVGTALFLAVFLLFDKSYGDATIWCWIDNDHELYRLFFLYFILLFSWLFNAIILHIVSKTISDRNQPNILPSTHHLALAEAEIQRKLRQYLLVFILSWFFGLLNRLMQVILDKPNFATSLLQAFFVPLQGFLNSICYGDIFEDCFNWKSGTSVSEISMSSSVPHSPSLSTSSNSFLPFSSLANLAPNLLNRKSVTYTSTLPQITYEGRSFSFFITTFNQGEATMADMREDIPSWLPSGHDIYVIGVQECLYLNEFRQFILDYLGGDSQFAQYTSEIGNTNTRLGFHGYIALSVYIRQTEIASGAIMLIDSNTTNVKTGRDLILATAPNKGAVGLSFKIHNTIVGFITAHLPSDSDGKSKMLRRNEVSQSVLREVVLSDEDTGCDVQFQHDYLFFLGDFNYRLNPVIPSLSKSPFAHSSPSSLPAPNNILLNVTSATFMERGFYPFDDSDWYQKKYKLFEGVHSSSYLNSYEQNRIIRNEASSQSEWAKVLSFDEMLYWMRVGEIYHGFHELPVRFPPTYKRKKGSSGSCGDYTNYGEVVQGFSHLGDQDSSDSEREDNKRTDRNDSGTTENDNCEYPRLPSSQRGDDEPHGLKSMSSFDVPVSSQGAGGAGGHHTRNRSDIASFTSSSTTNSTQPDPPKPARRATIFTLMKSESMDDKKKSKIRPPSYTDRILYHSLSPGNGKISDMKYGFCDAMRASDHRPVVMSMNLEVNKNIIPSSSIINTNNRSTLNTHVVILQLTISQFSVNYVGFQEADNFNPILMSMDSKDYETDGGSEMGQDKGSRNRGDSNQQSSSNELAISSPSSVIPNYPVSLKKLQVIFPISPKDPLLHYRKIYDLSQALHVNERTGLKLNFKSSQIKSELLQSKRIYPLENVKNHGGITFHSCIDISTDVEAVIILLDSSGKDLGQGVLHLTPFLQPEKMNSPQHIEQCPLTSGGKFLGYFSAVCTLKHIQTQLSFR